MTSNCDCPFGNACGGISGMFFGLPVCWQCYRLAPMNARDVHHVVTEYDRTGLEHPALSEKGVPA